jgi:hypothetical protein
MKEVETGHDATSPSGFFNRKSESVIGGQSHPSLRDSDFLSLVLPPTPSFINSHS